MLRVLLALLVLAGCKTSPTGRMQVGFLPESQLQSLGVAAFAQVKQKMKVSTNEDVNTYFRCITGEITAELPEQWDWEVVVFDHPSANAFAPRQRAGQRGVAVARRSYTRVSGIG